MKSNDAIAPSWRHDPAAWILHQSGRVGQEDRISTTIELPLSESIPAGTTKEPTSVCSPAFVSHAKKRLAAPNDPQTSHDRLMPAEAAGAT